MVNVIVRQALRRGPTRWFHVTLWDTGQDRFESGQWFRGRIYPEKCDVSPDGKLFIYFAGRFRARDVDKGYDRTWIAVSRPPYLTALMLWPVGDTWGGNGVFLDDRSVRIGTYGKHHPDHPPGPLQVVEYHSLKAGDPQLNAVPGWRSGWEGTLVPKPRNRNFPEYSTWRKASGRLILERDASRPNTWGELSYEEYFSHPLRRGSLYALHRAEGELIAKFQAHWVDFDQQGRLVATVGGRVFAGEVTKSGGLRWRQLAAMHEEQPTQMEAPKWAQAW